MSIPKSSLLPRQSNSVYLKRGEESVFLESDPGKYSAANIRTTGRNTLSWK